MADASCLYPYRAIAKGNQRIIMRPNRTAMVAHRVVGPLFLGESADAPPGEETITGELCNHMARSLVLDCMGEEKVSRIQQTARNWPWPLPVEANHCQASRPVGFSEFPEREGRRGTAFRIVLPLTESAASLPAGKSASSVDTTVPTAKAGSPPIEVHPSSSSSSSFKEKAKPA
jgi:hypothetical protein